MKLDTVGRYLNVFPNEGLNSFTFEITSPFEDEGTSYYRLENNELCELKTLLNYLDLSESCSKE